MPVLPVLFSAFALSALLLSMIAGCGVGQRPTGSFSSPLAITGTVHGGQQPVTGATVRLYAVGATGYGSASTSLLTQSRTTGDGGFFDITNDYQCASADALIYLTATGGNPGLSGSVDNSAISLVALMGRCGDLSATTHVVINEATTVAAAWALAPFANGLGAIGSSATNSMGIANAFSMAANIASIDRGQSPGDAPAGAGVPSAKINTLADILAACINSGGPSSPACTSLFGNTTVSGSTPAETFGAALNIAKSPGTNVAALYNISMSTGPFQPTLATAPNDWTIALAFVAGSAANTGLSIDGSGDIWLTNMTGLTRLSPAGSVLGTYASMAGQNVAVDANGNIWTGNGNGSYPTQVRLNRLSASLAGINTYPQTGPLSSSPVYDFGGFAFDASGNAWYTCGYCGQVSKTDASGTYVGGYARGGFHGLNLAIDAGNNVWSGDMDGDKVYRFTNAGTAAAGSPFSVALGSVSNVAADSSSVWFASGNQLYRLTAGGGLSSYSGMTNAGTKKVAVDGADAPWIISSTGVLSAFTPSGAALSAGSGYITSYLGSGLNSYNLAVDGAGNVWIPSNTGSTVIAFVGLAAPTVTPLALGVKIGTLGMRP